MTVAACEKARDGTLEQGFVYHDSEAFVDELRRQRPWLPEAETPLAKILLHIDTAQEQKLYLAGLALIDSLTTVLPSIVLTDDRDDAAKWASALLKSLLPCLRAAQTKPIRRAACTQSQPCSYQGLHFARVQHMCRTTSKMERVKLSVVRCANRVAELHAHIQYRLWQEHWAGRVPNSVMSWTATDFDLPVGCIIEDGWWIDGSMGL